MIGKAGGMASLQARVGAWDHLTLLSDGGVCVGLGVGLSEKSVDLRAAVGTRVLVGVGEEGEEGKRGSGKVNARETQRNGGDRGRITRVSVTANGMCNGQQHVRAAE
jgi:hypothetical protein